MVDILWWDQSSPLGIYIKVSQRLREDSLLYQLSNLLELAETRTEFLEEILYRYSTEEGKGNTLELIIRQRWCHWQCTTKPSSNK